MHTARSFFQYITHRVVLLGASVFFMALFLLPHSASARMVLVGDLNQDNVVSNSERQRVQELLSDDSVPSPLELQIFDGDRSGEVDAPDTLLAEFNRSQIIQFWCVNAPLATSVQEIFLVGDYNKNGLVSADEVARFDKLLANNPPPTFEELKLSDWDVDGRITASDRTAIGANTTFVNGNNRCVYVPRQLVLTTPTNVVAGSPYVLRWSSISIGTVKIGIKKGGAWVVSPTKGMQFFGNTTSIPNNNQFVWDVPRDLPDTTGLSFVVMDGNGSSFNRTSGAFNIVPQSPITITGPTAGSVQNRGGAMNVTWTHSVPQREGVLIRLLKGGVPVVGQQFGTQINPAYDYNNDGAVNDLDTDILISLFAQDAPCPSGKSCDLNGDGQFLGSDVTLLINYVANYSTTIPDSGSYSFPLPQSLVAGNDYSVQVIAGNTPTLVGTSPVFSIQSTGITVTAPAAGTRLREGNATQIRWTVASAQPGDLVEVEVMKQNPFRAVFHAKDIPYNLGTQSWTVAPLQQGSNFLYDTDYFIRAFLYRTTPSFTVIATSSSAQFTIEQKRSITVSTPTNVFGDTPVTLNWNATGLPGAVSIRILTSTGDPIVSGGRSQAFGTKCFPLTGTTCVNTAPVPNTGSFTWNVPADVVGTGFKVVVYDDSEPLTTQGSSATFSIGAAFDRYDLNNDRRTDHLDRAIMRTAVSSGSCGAIAPRTCDLDRNGTSGDSADLQMMTNRLLFLYDFSADGANENPDNSINQKDIDWFNAHIVANNLSCPSAKRCDITVDSQSFKGDDLVLLGLIAEISPRLTLTTPNNGETMYLMSPYPIQWTTEGAVPSITINLLQGGAVRYTAVGPVSNAGTFTWTVPPTVAPGQYDLEVRGDATIFDLADKKITIVAPHVDPIAPISGSSCETRKQCVISWNPISNGALLTDKIHLTLMRGGSSAVIGDVNNSGSYQWTTEPLVPGAYGVDYKIGFDVVRSSTVIPGSHTESSSFEVAESRTISIVAPSANGKIERGKSSVIRWNATGAVGSTRLIIKKGNTVILTAGPISTKEYTWTIPNSQALGADYTVRVESIGDTAVYGLSNQFSIVPKPAISVRTPNGGETWAIDDGLPGSKNPTPRSIKWVTGGIVGPTVNIELMESTEPVVPATICTASCDANGDGAVDANDEALEDEFRRYDLNSDGRVDQTDEDVISSIDNGTGGIRCAPTKNCDINRDGSINGADVSAHIAYQSRIYDIDQVGGVTADDVEAFKEISGSEQSCSAGRFCDFNGNGKGVDSGDLVALTNYIATGGYSWGNRARYDLNLDGKVDLGDVNVLSDIVSEVTTCPTFFQGPGLSKTCDLSGDGDVFGNDVTMLVNIANQQVSAGGDRILGVVASGVPNNGEYRWTITNPFVVASSDLKIVISDPLTGVRDESDSTFTINDAPVNLEITGVSFPSGPNPTLTINDLKPVSVSAFTLSANNKSSRPARGIQIAARITQGSGATAATHIAMDPVSIVCAPALDPGFIPAPSPNCRSVDPGQVIHAADSDQISGKGVFVEGPAKVEFQLLYENRVVASKKFDIKLVPKPEIIVVAPNGGESWTIGGRVIEGVVTPAPYEIKWRSRGLVGPVDIYLVKTGNYAICGFQCNVNGDGVVDINDQRLAEEFRTHDINNDGRVDKIDRDFMKSLFNESGGLTCPQNKICDLNHDGTAGDAGDITSFVVYIEKLYDVNRSGSVSEEDIDTFREIVINERPCAPDQYCDFNSNGSVEAGDLTSLINYVGTGGYSRGEQGRYDLNLDGVVDRKDVDFITAVLAGTESCTSVDGIENPIKKCDLDNDNGVFGTDVTLLQNFINKPTGGSGEGVIAQVQPNKSDGPQAGQGGKFLWLVANEFVRSGDDYKVMIKEHARPTEIFDDSDSPFSIVLPAPTIISPPVGKFYFIDPAFDMKVNATHAMNLTRYRVQLVQNGRTLYDSGVNTPVNVPITFDKNTCAAADGKAIYGVDGQAIRNLTDCLAKGGHRLLDQLREGRGATGLRIIVEGARMDEANREVFEYTPQATRVVELRLNREAPTIVKPTLNQEIALSGKIGITIEATHKAKPAFYDVILKQNGSIKYEQVEVEANAAGVLQLTLTRDTEFGGEQLFKKFDKGPVELLVRATLIGGEHTAYASRIFTVIPLPADYDLNDDGEINTDDFQILNGVILFESKSERIKPESQRSGRACPRKGQVIAGKTVKFDKNCNLTGDKDPSGRDVVNSLDLAAMKAHPAFEDNTESFGRVPGAVSTPTLHSPVSGSAWVTGAPQDIVIEPFPGATGYLVGFIKGGKLIFENYRDMNRNLSTIAGSNGTQIFRVPAEFKSRFTAGADWQIWVRALITDPATKSSQWTDASVVPLEINATGVPSQPPSDSSSDESSSNSSSASGSSGAQQATGSSVGGVDPSAFEILSPTSGTEWRTSNPNVLIIKKVAGATGYHLRAYIPAAPRGTSDNLNVLKFNSEFEEDKETGTLSYQFTGAEQTSMSGMFYLTVTARSGSTQLAQKTIELRMR